MSDYRHCYCDVPSGYDLDTINGIALVLVRCT